MENAADRVSFAVTYSTVQIRIDGRNVYSGGVDELKELLEQHVKFMDYIDSCEGDDGQLD